VVPDELSAEQRGEIAEQLARRVVGRKLESAAILFLEMNKPIAFLGGQALLMAAPLFGTLFGYENAQRLALFFQSSENVEMLIRRIEEMSRERDAREGSEPGGPATAPERSG